ncbi:MAG TPA: anthranilate phosphoribosyltransferase [Planctomycetota bacterium]|nr:anthranilate phosphoribosyltransferase [Planctomycetota bacterium]
MLKDATAALLAGRALSAEDATAAMGEIMDGAVSPVQIAAFLTALRIKGETVAEIAGCARALRARMLRFDAGPGPLVDTCGTGGDGVGTFNVSTAAAFVVAACGGRVAKHGNRAASSACGSADVLEALGVKIEQPKERLEGILKDVGLVYLHAPAFHPAMKHAGPVRKELGFRTVFNLLGPLCNPAGADVQIVGLFSPALVRPYAEVLQALGSRAALTVHGHGGLDELSTTGPNTAVVLKDGRLRELSIAPAEAGLPTGRIEDLKGGSAAQNAAIVRSIFAGEKGPRRDIVVLNAAAALALAGRARDLRDGAAQAAHALDAGLARRVLDALVAATAA